MSSTGIALGRMHAQCNATTFFVRLCCVSMLCLASLNDLACGAAAAAASYIVKTLLAHSHFATADVSRSHQGAPTPKRSKFQTKPPPAESPGLSRKFTAVSAGQRTHVRCVTVKHIIHGL